MAITASNYWPLGSTVPKTFTNLNVGTDVKHFGFISVNPVNGCMVMFYRKASTYVGTIGTICMRRSNDGGAHWNDDIQILSESNVDLRNLAGGYTSSGRLNLFYGRYYNSTSWYPIGFTHSDDDGVTWSTPSTLNTQPGSSAFSPYGHIVEVGSTYYQTWYEANAGVYSLRISKSSDGGSTYPTSDIITIYSSSNTFTEPTMVHVGGGCLLVIARINGGTCFAQFVSTDGGSTWSGSQNTSFETWTNGQNNAWLSFINYQGVGIVACYYMRRDNSPTRYVKVVYGLASNLLQYGVTGWNAATLRTILSNSASIQTGCVSFWHPQNQIAGIGIYFYVGPTTYPVVLFTPTNNIINGVLAALMP